MHKTDWKFLLSLDASPRPAMAYDMISGRSLRHCRQLLPEFSTAAACADSGMSVAEMKRMMYVARNREGN